MKEHKSNYIYGYDESQAIGKAYGATNTPQFFVLDKERKIRYTGAMDDSQREDKVTKTYLRDAVDAVLKGEKRCRRGNQCRRLWRQLQEGDLKPDETSLARCSLSKRARGWSGHAISRASRSGHGAACFLDPLSCQSVIFDCESMSVIPAATTSFSIFSRVIRKCDLDPRFSPRRSDRPIGGL